MYKENLFEQVKRVIYKEDCDYFLNSSCHHLKEIDFSKYYYCVLPTEKCKLQEKINKISQN